MRDAKYLLPDNYETVKATEILGKGRLRRAAVYESGSECGERSAECRCGMLLCRLQLRLEVIRGLRQRHMIQILIDEIDLPIIVDAGIGKPSQACEAMEMGAAAIMANTAIATAGDVPAMAAAFKLAIEAGRKAYLTGMGRVLARGGSASDPLTGFLR